MKNLRETREVVRMLGAIYCRTMRVRADGKVSFGEKVGYLGDFPEVWDGIRGIAEVPAELADLDPNEKVVLIGDIRMELLHAGFSHRDTDAATLIMEWAYNLVRSTVLTFNQIKHAPPSALPA